MYSKSLFVLSAIAAVACAQGVQYSNNGIAFTVNIPADTASSGKGSVYIQMAAPSGTEWLGVGQGGQMSGANMLIMYAASSTNITVSPRLGQGQFEPNFNPDASIAVLEGSGITSSGQMVANIRCDSCLSWSGGSMSPTDSSSSWIWSIKSGSALDSTSTSEDLSQHDTFGTFSLDLTTGTGGSSSNPFVAASSSGGSSSSAAASGGSSATATATSGGSSPSSTSASGPVSVPSSVSSSGGSSSGGFSTPVDGTRAGHAAIMSAVFLVMFPSFALTLYLPYAKRVRFIHAPLQLLSIVLLIIGLALGVKLGNSIGIMHGYHQIVGYVIFAVMVFVQPAMGIYQHIYYHKHGGRSALGVFHQWLGRTVILAGVVNGGLGFYQTGSVGSVYVPNYSVVVYSIVAVLVFIIYVAVVFISKRRAGRNAAGDEKIGGRSGYEMHPSSRDQGTDYSISAPLNYQQQGFQQQGFQQQGFQQQGYQQHGHQGSHGSQNYSRPGYR